jgi:hypothetical protein
MARRLVPPCPDTKLPSAPAIIATRQESKKEFLICPFEAGILLKIKDDRIQETGTTREVIEK